MTLKDSWKETGIEFMRAFTVLGKTLVKTTKEGIRKLDEWSNSGPGEFEDSSSDGQK